MISMSAPVINTETDCKFIQDVTMVVDQEYEYWNLCRLFGISNKREDEFIEEITASRKIWEQEVWSKI